VIHVVIVIAMTSISVIIKTPVITLYINKSTINNLAGTLLFCDTEIERRFNDMLQPSLIFSKLPVQHNAHTNAMQCLSDMTSYYINKPVSHKLQLCKEANKM